MSSGFKLGTARPWSTNRLRFCLTATTFGLIVASRPHSPTMAEPSLHMTSDAAPTRSGYTNLPSAK
jgi:hypothetical protein